MTVSVQASGPARPRCYSFRSDLPCRRRVPRVLGPADTAPKVPIRDALEARS
jgi:hypothetical protein